MVERDSTNEDDISSEWSTLVALPSSKPQTEPVDLRREYMGMAEHPEYIYRLLEVSFGVAYMSIWRCKCFGQKRVQRVNRLTDCWVVQYDVCLWKGAKVDQAEAARQNPRDLGRVFAIPKKQSYTTLAEVLSAFAKERDESLRRTRYEIQRWRTDIARLEKDVRTYEAEAAALDGFMPFISE